MKKKKLMKIYLILLDLLHNLVRQEVSGENMRKWLFNYISFCSWRITYAIRLNLSPSDDLNNSFSTLLSGLYSENNLYKLFDNLMNIFTGCQEEKIIDLDMFKRMLEQYDILTIENLRDFLLTENEKNDRYYYMINSLKYN